jgi:hypothetical protein
LAAIAGVPAGNEITLIRVALQVLPPGGTAQQPATATESA